MLKDFIWSKKKTQVIVAKTQSLIECAAVVSLTSVTEVSGPGCSAGLHTYSHQLTDHCLDTDESPSLYCLLVVTCRRKTGNSVKKPVEEK